MSSKVWSVGIPKHTKMIQHLVHIRSTGQFNQVRVHEKTRKAPRVGANSSSVFAFNMHYK